MSAQSFIIENVEPARFPEVQAFYATVNYTYPIDPHSMVVVARRGAQILGAARLCYQERIQVLRGFMIDPHFERQGIGTLMLHELEKKMGARDCFCLPHKWLDGFFGQIGFQVVPDESLPPILQTRLAELRAGEYPNVIAMRRAALSTIMTVQSGEISSS